MILAVGAPRNNGGGRDSGHVRVYQWAAGSLGWIQKGSDINGEAANDHSGSSVALSSSGTILAIGAPNNQDPRAPGTGSGHVRVYQWAAGIWTQKGSDIGGEAAGDGSGRTLALSADGTILAIGANANDGAGANSGHVRLYKWTTKWIQLGSDIDGEAAQDDSGFGIALSANGMVVAIGARQNDGAGIESGQVRVYEYGATGTEDWIQKGSAIHGEAAGDHLGVSVALSSDGMTLAIGSVRNDGAGENSGHVRVYQWASGSWSQKGPDIDGDAAGDGSGRSVALSSDGTILAIGASRSVQDRGYVRVYQWATETWTQKCCKIDGKANGDRSGYSVALSSDGMILAIGAKGSNGGVGQVRVFETVGSQRCGVRISAERLARARAKGFELWGSCSQ